jgi:sugar phosphate isomerase/epimerase
MAAPTASPSSLRARLVASPTLFPYWPLEQVFDACRQVGFVKFEAFVDWVECRLDWRGDPVPIRRLAAEHGLAISSFHLPKIGDDVAAGVRDALAAARYGAGLGADVVLFKATSRENYIKAARPFLDGLAREKIAVTPVLQNHMNSPIETVAHYREIFDGIGGDPRLKTLLEVGHFWRVGVPWTVGWDYMLGRMALIHVNEIRGKDSVPYGTGEVDFAGLLRRIGASGYAGNIVVELETATREAPAAAIVESARHCVAHLERLHAQG